MPVEDAYAGLRWPAGYSQGVGVDPSRIAVMGDSAGGSIAAGGPCWQGAAASSLRARS